MLGKLFIGGLIFCLLLIIIAKL